MLFMSLKRVFMMSSFKAYWVGVRDRIATQIKDNHCLESLVVKKQRINLNNSGLSFRAKSGCLVPHCYTQFIDPENKSSKKIRKTSLNFKKGKLYFSSLSD
ncbi:hypothetical protein CE131_18785 [Vibrio parahaemolyticus]|nr:hypothetical protein [Vibrio parahaemolyticus]PWF70546.1 hypothetical protein CCD93_04030 [Vibrio sp. T21]EGQ8749908.1 hypothetical protein [Vibrio parahaemolyticus]EGQ8758853.1 hypothetical protein [Vibrio parahaemolyticus]EGQ8772418.1 hypothetical protein [Vibrio parahaemolyticus]